MRNSLQKNRLFAFVQDDLWDRIPTWLKFNVLFYAWLALINPHDAAILAGVEAVALCMAFLGDKLIDLRKRRKKNGAHGKNPE